MISDPGPWGWQRAYSPQKRAYPQSRGREPPPPWLLRDERGCLCVEMESFALFANAEVLGKNAACLLTISDSFVSPEITTAEQRQKSFTDMMKVALGAEY